MTSRSPVPLQLSRPAELPWSVEKILLTVEREALPIKYLGVQSYQPQPVLYAGQDRDWVFAPIDLDPLYLDGGGSLPIPRPNLADLRRMVEFGINFPAIFIAHDVPKSDEEDLLRSGDALMLQSSRPLTLDELDQLVQPVPPPVEVEQKSRRYGQACQAMAKVLKVGAVTTGAVAAGIAFAPLAVGSAIMSDPALFGAVPLSGSLREGDPAAWFYLTSWVY